MLGLSKHTDEELVILAKENEQASEELINRYTKIIKSIANKYYLVGYDEKDILQEGYIALLKAIMSYNGESSFKAFFYKCLINKIYTLIKSSNSLKNKPLNNYVSLNGYTDGDNDKSEIIMDSEFGPEDAYINGEAEKEFLSLIENCLSKLEYRIIKLYVQGFSYSAIAKSIGKTEKSIDNALQRARKKILTKINQK
ncbi:MAG: sigma-70 family RNA polymerase sigma factor [Clostridiales bacterium]|nr:sigma-70 family RNA polymerase sigma factor [Clostridiales bacterium]